MKSNAKQLILIISLILAGTYFLFEGLVKAKTFLAPLVVAILLALLMIPVSRKLESWGIKRGWAAFICDLIVLAFFAGLFFIISAQVQSIVKDWPQIKEKLKPKIEQVQQYIGRHTNMSTAEVKQKLKENISGDAGQGTGSSTQSTQSSGLGIGSAVSRFFSFLGTSLLTFVYIFFFLLYREKFRLSALRFFPPEKQGNAKEVIHDSGKVSQNYLLGKLIMIIILAILYSIGLSVSGIQHAILISIIAAVLSLLPYIGNIIGFGLALAMGLFSGGSTNALIGITITFAIAQFVESYILEPYIVGHQVDLHPVFTIIVVVLGGHLWGIVGMIIAIPVFGIFKVIFDHVPILNPLGYLLGEKDGSSDQENNFFQRVYKKFQRK